MYTRSSPLQLLIQADPCPDALRSIPRYLIAMHESIAAEMHTSTHHARHWLANMGYWAPNPALCGRVISTKHGLLIPLNRALVPTQQVCAWSELRELYLNILQSNYLTLLRMPTVVVICASYSASGFDRITNGAGNHRGMGSMQAVRAPLRSIKR